MTKSGRASIILCAALAACQPPAQTPAANAVDEADKANAVADNGADNGAEPQRSILRPEVVPETETPKIEPAEAVIGFGESSMALDETAKATVETLLASPAMQAGGPITLRGHSDSRGSDGDNKVASRIRAEKVRDYLVEKGVDEARITLVALGEARPVAPNAKEDGSDDPDGRAKNRRVEVTVALPTIIVPPPVAPNATEAAKP
ncbi:OmpA family protein [Sphingobium cupriresistens]|uniref:Membrane protein n=1 Tax=Sphingobium cupriresistens LL01 TaxID=1420583 RepID=A0A0J7XYV7_9SPHN|nr:OmpA family protein [Sphingobium cupriresistens]KMS56851.1 membrane protein [Sphingobium cupriresistens LL01]